jgi:RNA polymerase sigma-70 factor, ECF subfamily
MSHSKPIPRLSDDDREAFHTLYLAHHRRIYSICLRMTQSVSDAEDLTQEIFIHLFRKLETFRGDAAFTTWLHRLTVNHVLMHFRKRSVRSELPTEDGKIPTQVVAGSKDPRQMRVVDRILLSEVIAKLPEGYRDAFIMHDIEGLEHNEIAQRRGRSAGTSKSQLHKARMMLRQLITQTSQQRRPIQRIA